MICRRVTYFTDMGMVKYYQKYATEISMTKILAFLF